MLFFKEIIFCFIQGIIEFLPISSSGHLLIIQNMFNFNIYNIIFFNTILHLSTLIPIFIIFYVDIKKIFINIYKILINIFKNFKILINNKIKHKQIKKNIYTYEQKIIIFIILSFISSSIIGLLLYKFIKIFNNNLLLLNCCFFITSIILIIIDTIEKNNKTLKNIKYNIALIIGILQGLAIIPGISRFGIIVITYLLCGFNKNTAIKYSFILLIPTVICAIIFELINIHFLNITYMLCLKYFILMCFTCIISFISIKILLKYINYKIFKIFGIYCFFISFCLLFFDFIL